MLHVLNNDTLPLWIFVIVIVSLVLSGWYFTGKEEKNAPFILRTISKDEDENVKCNGCGWSGSPKVCITPEDEPPQCPICENRVY